MIRGIKKAKNKDMLITHVMNGIFFLFYLKRPAPAYLLVRSRPMRKANTVRLGVSGTVPDDLG